jgi:hypothetical protein
MKKTRIRFKIFPKKKATPYLHVIIKKQFLPLQRKGRDLES